MRRADGRARVGVSCRALCLALAALASAPGCKPYERVVEFRPALANLPGAEASEGVTPRRSRTLVHPALAPVDEIVKEDEEGNKTLTARTGRHLMRHIYATLRDNDEELFVGQVLSSVTLKEFEERGHDPGEAFRHLKEHERDVHRLFNLMPMGEQTPGVFLKPLGGRVFRMELTGLGARGLRWSGVDMVFEGGNWRLRWFVPGPG